MKESRIEEERRVIGAVRTMYDRWNAEDERARARESARVACRGKQLAPPASMLLRLYQPLAAGDAAGAEAGSGPLGDVIARAYAIGGTGRFDCWQKLVEALTEIKHKAGLLHYRLPEGRSNVEYAGVYDVSDGGNVDVGMIRVEWHTDDSGYVTMQTSFSLAGARV